MHKYAVKKAGQSGRKSGTAVNFELKNWDCPSKSGTVGEYGYPLINIINQ